MARGAGRRSLFFFRVPSVRTGLFIGASRRKRARRCRLRCFGSSASAWAARPGGPCLFGLYTGPSVLMSTWKGASRREACVVDLDLQSSPTSLPAEAAKIGRTSSVGPFVHNIYLIDAHECCTRLRAASTCVRQRIFRNQRQGCGQRRRSNPALRASVGAQSSATRRQRRGCGAQ